MICSTSGVLDSWDSSFVRFLDNSASMFALSFNRNSSSCHCRSRPISGPVADRPARDSSSISLDTAAFREPILSSADVVQRVVENCCLVHENWVLYVNHVLVRLSSILLLSLPLPKFLADFQELDLLPERSRDNSSLCLWKNRASHVRVAELASARCNCVIHCFSPSIDKVFPRSRFISMSCSRNSPCCGSRERRAVSRWSYRASRARCATNWKSFLRSKNCKYTLRIRNRILSLPRIHSSLIGYRSETVNNVAQGRSKLVRTSPMQ